MWLMKLKWNCVEHNTTAKYGVDCIMLPGCFGARGTGALYRIDGIMIK